jgi:hypothetical protein
MDTVVLIDGFGDPGCDWAPWKDRYTARGVRVEAPGWPGIDAIASFYEGVVAELDAPPVLMGHAFGGLVVQTLLDGGFGAAGVAIDASIVSAEEGRAPLLLVGGGLDHLAPASLAAVAEKRFYRGGPITEYRAFPALTNASLGREGWESVADFALDWALAHARVPSPAAT